MQIRPSVLEIPTDDPFKNDCLSRDKLEPTLTQVVTQAVGSFVLAVDGSWGSGKTTFLNMWQVKLNEAGHLCFYLNAWKSDFVEDPLVAVVGELSIAIKETSLLDKDNVRKTIDRIEKKARSIVKRLIPAAAKMVTFGVVDTDSAIERELSIAAGTVTENLIQDYEKGKTDIEEFRDDLKFLANAIQEPNREPVKIVIIIDELDRCRPTYAVQLLERIKHLFDVEGVVFVLGIDRAQLSHSIKALYGSEFDATRYLKRFIDLDYRLPEPKLGCYCSSLFEKFEINSLLSKRSINNDNSQYGLQDLEFYLGYFISSAQMSLRDQEQIVSRLRVVLQTIPTDRRLYPIMLSIILFLYNYSDKPELYLSFIDGKLSFNDFLAFIKALPNEKEAFEIFSDKGRDYGYSGFFNERIEGVFLAGTNEILGNGCLEAKKYIDSFKSNNHISDEDRYIAETISRERGCLGITVQRLNLTSNFVQY